jgi:hypothetical protein
MTQAMLELLSRLEASLCSLPRLTILRFVYVFVLGIDGSEF